MFQKCLIIRTILGQLSSDDVSLFISPSKVNINFEPTFADELPKIGSLYQNILSKCNGDDNCIIDYQLSGIEVVGKKTAEYLYSRTNVAKINCK